MGQNAGNRAGRTDACLYKAIPPVRFSSASFNIDKPLGLVPQEKSPPYTDGDCHSAGLFPSIPFSFSLPLHAGKVACVSLFQTFCFTNALKVNGLLLYVFVAFLSLLS